MDYLYIHYIQMYRQTGYDQTSITDILIYLLFYCACPVFCRTKGGDADKVNKDIWFGQSMSHFLNNVFNKENLLLTDLPGWSQGSADDSNVSYILNVLLILRNMTVLQNTDRGVFQKLFNCTLCAPFVVNAVGQW